MKRYLPTRWGFIFLEAYGPLPYEDKIYLVEQAAEMYFKEENKREIKTDGLEGIIITKGEHGVIGSFGGQKYSARVENDYGKSKLSFLISEQTGFSHYSTTVH
ncbi:hypothetical protein AYK26_05005 [Euryarchaeota archaeon SM23-78]|nr:MAG: hypothetical protein AYK26_05005 [Euryarchaeota archaeon SM23-78]MBW3000929.1 hypothetical protein [Candidatus Woesearchaeota archaeon]